jgi:hypothetical protein
VIFRPNVSIDCEGEAPAADAAALLQQLALGFAGCPN